MITQDSIAKSVKAVVNNPNPVIKYGVSAAIVFIPLSFVDDAGIPFAKPIAFLILFGAILVIGNRL